MISFFPLSWVAVQESNKTKNLPRLHTVWVMVDAEPMVVWWFLTLVSDPPVPGNGFAARHVCWSFSTFPYVAKLVWICFFYFHIRVNKQTWWTPWNVIAFNKKLYYPKCLFLVWANQAIWGCSSLRIGKHMEIHHPTSQATNSLQKYLLGMSPKEIKGTCDILLKSSERYILYTCNLKKCKWMNQDPGIISQVLFGSTQKQMVHTGHFNSLPKKSHR